MYKSVDAFMETVISKNPGQDEFHQAVQEVVESIWDYLQENPQYLHTKILDRIVECLSTRIFSNIVQPLERIGLHYACCCCRNRKTTLFLSVTPLVMPKKCKKIGRSRI